jgi:trans-aconitate methyltransferase
LERYGRVAAASIGALLDKEEAERARPLGRALDLGCGRGQQTQELARRGWEAVGIDNIPRAIYAANRRANSGATFVVGDVTDLAPADLGTLTRSAGRAASRSGTVPRPLPHPWMSSEIA